MSTLFSTRPLVSPAQPLDMSWQGSSSGTDYLGQYAVSTVQEHCYGRRLITDLGKLFCYSLSSGECYTGRGNAFQNTISSSANGIDYRVLYAAQNKGDSSVQMLNAGSSAIAENYLAGGQIVIKLLTGSSDAALMMRTVVGNTAAVASSGICTIYLDRPLDQAVTTSSYAFVMPSPFTNIKYESTSGTKSFAGPAAAYVSATGYFFWTQMYGPYWLAPQSRVGTTAYYRTVYWRHDGSIDIGTQINSSVTDQRAGYILDNNADSNGVTVIQLTGMAI